MDSKGEQSLESDNGMSLHSACCDGHIEIVEQLLSLGFDIDSRDSNGQTPLMFAARYDQPDLFRFLIDRGSDPTLKDNHGWTLLHFAAAGGSDDIIEKLLFLGLDIDSRNNSGLTPLMTAAFCHPPDLLHFLLERDSDPTLTDNHGWSLLHFAAAGGRYDIIKELVFLKFDINSRSSNGRTPLMIAICCCQPELLTFLIASGSFTTLKDNYGCSLMHLAAARTSIITSLRNYYFLDLTLIQGTTMARHH